MGKNNLKTVVVLGTGGTIAGTAASASDNTGYTAAQIGVARLLEAVPGLKESLQGYALHSEQVAQLDSKDMDFVTMARLASRCLHFMAQDNVAGIVITHGTDTLEETAYFLHLLLASTPISPGLSSHKPVVLTCAMRPATSSEADGPANVRDAVTVALDPQAHGVLCVCAGDVHLAALVQKVHSHRLNAFSSGDVQPVGHVRASGQAAMALVTWKGTTNPNYQEKQASASMEHARAAIELVASIVQWPRVEIILSHAGATGALVRTMLQAQGDHKDGGKLQGIIAAGTGNGTLQHDLQAALLEAKAQGVAVVRSTRCHGGVTDTAYDALPSAGALPYAKARIRMVLQLAGIKLAGIKLAEVSMLN